MSSVTASAGLDVALADRTEVGEPTVAGDRQLPAGEQPVVDVATEHRVDALQSCRVEPQLGRIVHGRQVGGGGLRIGGRGHGVS